MCRTPTRRVNQMLELAEKRLSEGNISAASALANAVGDSIESIATVESNDGVPVGVRLRQLRKGLSGHKSSTGLNAIDEYD